MTLTRIAYAPRYAVLCTLIAATIPVLVVVALCGLALAVIGRCMIWVSE